MDSGMGRVGGRDFKQAKRGIIAMKNVVKLSEYRQKKRREAEKGRGWVVRPIWVVAGLFTLSVALVFVYLLVMGGRP